MSATQTERMLPSTQRRFGPGLIVIIAVVALAALGGMMAVSTYNRLVTLDQGVQAQWAQVENAYQRRADLVPSLVETVKGAANFEKDTLTQVIEARSRATQAPAKAPSGNELEQYQRSQDELGTALSRLMVVVEAYPQLKATEAFRDLQAQLEGTENRIAVERMRFNQAAQGFNTTRDRFPTALFANFFGSRFAEKSFFRAREGSQLPPKVQF